MTNGLFHVVAWAGDHWHPLAIFRNQSDARNWMTTYDGKSSVFVLRTKQLSWLRCLTGPELLRIIRSASRDLLTPP